MLLTYNVMKYKCDNNDNLIIITTLNSLIN